MKIRALPKFEGIKDLERNVFPKEGDIWEVSEERANFLKSHGVIEFVEDDIDITEYEFKVRDEETKKILDEKIKEAEEMIKTTKKSKKKNKKTSE